MIKTKEKLFLAELFSRNESDEKTNRGDREVIWKATKY